MDTLIVIPNDRLLQLADKRASLPQAFDVNDLDIPAFMRRR